MQHPAPDLVVTLADGRRLAVDDRGDPGGIPVVFFHGTPDTRVARHPDDSIARDLGIRVIAFDRPGLGSSDADPMATPISVADDVAEILDHLDLAAAHVLAWSAGTITALAFAGRHGDRTRSITLVAPLVPADAYDDAGVLDGADDSRRLFAQVIADTTANEAGRELAIWLVPPHVDEATAREMLADSIASLAGIPGAGDALVEALVGSTSQGMVGLEREVAAQATRLETLLDDIAAPVHIHAGDADSTTPIAMAHWIASRLDAHLHVHSGLGHHVALHRWREILTGISDSPQ